MAVSLRRGVILALVAALAMVLAACGKTTHIPPAGVVTFGLTGTPGSAKSAVGPEVGKLAPNFRLATTYGTLVTLSDLRGNPVLLNFWATWCPPCRSEMPAMQKVHDQMRDKGLVVLAVDVEEQGGDVADYKRSLGITFATPLDQLGDVSGGYHVVALPSTFIIDKDGFVRQIRVGAFPDEASIMRILEPVL